MKVKLDFISNSSSTSFVYISEEELSKDAFMKAAGVEPGSAVESLFNQMYSELRQSIASGQKITTKSGIDQLLDEETFTAGVIERMNKAIESGSKVVVGSLSSEGNLAESTMCTEIFEIESDEFFINAYNSYW